jgi:sulfopropanediol 3-dehydrogenase
LTTYLKDPNPPTTEATQELRDRVSAMLLEIEREGIDAVRRYSRDLDGWDPESFVSTAADVARVEASLDDALKEHIAFAQGQVRAFAEAQRGTLADLEVELGGGVVLGHKHIPVGAVGAYIPGGRYPMLASSFMTILVAKTAAVEQVVGCAPPQREKGIHPAMLYAMHTSGADAVVCLGGVQALAAMAFSTALRRSTCWSGPATPTSPRPSASSSAGSGSTCSPGRPRSWSSPTSLPTLASRPPTSSARPSMARPRPQG